MTECARLRLENRLLEMKMAKLIEELAEARHENEVLRGVIGEAIDKLEEMQAKKKLIIEVEYGGKQ